MDRQKIIFENLTYGPFPSNLATILFSSRMEKGDVVYVSGNYKIQEPNYILPDDKRDWFEHDIIMMLSVCGERMDRGKLTKKVVNRFFVSVEIKTTERDLFKSTIDQYLGATRLFFLAVPRDLIGAVVGRYRRHPRKEVIGLIDSDAGQVVVLPQVQDFQKDRCDRLLARCYTSTHRYPYCTSDSELYAPHRVVLNGYTAPTWVDFDGLRVNADYLPYFRR